MAPAGPVTVTVCDVVYTPLASDSAGCTTMLAAVVPLLAAPGVGVRQCTKGALALPLGMRHHDTSGRDRAGVVMSARKPVVVPSGAVSTTSSAPLSTLKLVCSAAALAVRSFCDIHTRKWPLAAMVVPAGNTHRNGELALFDKPQPARLMAAPVVL